MVATLCYLNGGNPLNWDCLNQGLTVDWAMVYTRDKSEINIEKVKCIKILQDSVTLLTCNETFVTCYCDDNRKQRHKTVAFVDITNAFRNL